MIPRSPRSFHACHRLLLAVGLSVSALAPAWAERADANRPMNIEADRGRYDDQKGVTTFSGNVIVTKGTIMIRAGDIEVRQTSDGHQLGVATAAAGKLVSFRQKRDGADETIQGEAERVEYDTRTDTVRLVNRAVIKRYRGNVLADETSGNLITFDNRREVFSVSGDGSQNAGEIAPAPGGRVRATITPPPPVEAPPAASAPAEAAPAASDPGVAR